MSKGFSSPSTWTPPLWTNLRCRTFVFLCYFYPRGKGKLSSHVIWSFEIPQQHTKYQLVYLYTLNMCIHALSGELWARDTYFHSIQPTLDEITSSNLLIFVIINRELRENEFISFVNCQWERKFRFQLSTAWKILIPVCNRLIALWWKYPYEP